MILDAGVVLLGFLVGLVSGATGIGGGTLLAPFLMFVLKVDPFVSVGTDLFVSVVTKGVGSLIHKRAGNVEMSSIVPLCIAGLLGAIGGAILLAHLKTHVDVHAAQYTLRRIIGITLVVCAGAIMLSSRIRSGHRQFDKPLFLAPVAAIVACITSITGVGVGSLSVPALYFVKGRSAMAAVVGTSLVFATLVTAVGAAAHMALHDVNYGLSALLLIGSIPGVALGSTLATRAPAALKPLVVVLLVLSGARLIIP
jgi:hypothetical protein